MSIEETQARGHVTLLCIAYWKALLLHNEAETQVNAVHLGERRRELSAAGISEGQAQFIARGMVGQQYGKKG